MFDRQLVLLGPSPNAKKSAMDLPPLPADVWFIIFVRQLRDAFENGEFDEEYKEVEEQHKRDGWKGPHQFYRWLGDMRRVCQKFNAIITPLVYETVELSSALSMKRLIETPASSQIVANMQTHSICLRVTPLYKPEFQQATHDLILGCKRCEYIVWDVGTGEGEKFEREVARIASTYVDAFIKNKNRNRKRVRFMTHRDGFMVEESPSDWEGNNNKRAKPIAAREAQPDVYAQYPRTIAAPEKFLELLQLEVSPNRGITLVPVGGRYPPMKKLELENYPWTHSREETEQLFDFSKLKRLSFDCCNALFVSNFLAAANHEHILKLEELKVANLWDNEDTADRLHAQLSKVLDGLRNLTYLKLDYEAWESVLSSSALWSSAYTLRTLELRAGWRCRMLTFQGLMNFIERCTRLEYLSLDLDMSKPDDDVNCFFYYCTHLEHLETLELHARENLGRRGVEDDSSDTDYDSAAAIFDRLRREKVGVPYTRISILLLNATAPPGWRPTPIPAEEQEEGEEEILEDWDGFREFTSGFNEDGIVEQTGSEKVGPPEVGDAEDDDWTENATDDEGDSSADDGEDGDGFDDDENEGGVAVIEQEIEHTEDEGGVEVGEEDIEDTEGEGSEHNTEIEQGGDIIAEN
ncbi:uncharacterized protein PAC_17467 [Phialocephala subalpina]|uniref:Uncharacterized protein n=1 Tax=Phialocephala subalpina TaxID=576137 RepID=A0A1L7XRJ1_9HELO|nr:uncharacterized protein PAC_17467 [Phialocephala subalpina]